MNFEFRRNQYLLKRPTIEVNYVSGSVRIEATSNPTPLDIGLHLFALAVIVYYLKHEWSGYDGLEWIIGGVMAVGTLADLARDFFRHETMEISGHQITIHRPSFLGGDSCYELNSISDFGFQNDDKEGQFFGFKHQWRSVKFARQIAAEDADRILATLQSADLLRRLPLSDPLTKHFTTLNLSGR